MIKLTHISKTLMKLPTLSEYSLRKATKKLTNHNLFYPQFVKRTVPAPGPKIIIKRQGTLSINLEEKFKPHPHPKSIETGTVVNPSARFGNFLTQR